MAGCITLDPDRPAAEALAIAGGRILAVGGNGDILELRGPRKRAIFDAGGASVLPGFTDAHVHLFIGAAELDQLNVAGLSGEEALTRAVRDYAAARPDDALVYANGAFYGDARPGRPTTRHELDRMIPDRPFAMMAADHHTVWANTAALRAAGLLDAAGPRPGAEVVAGPDGRASGELRESPAFGAVLALTPLGGRELLGYVTGEDPRPPATPAQRATDRQVLARGPAPCRRATASRRCTTWTATSTSSSCWRNWRPRASCICRTQVPFHLKPHHPLDRLAEADEMRRRWHSDRLWSGRVKMFMDGVMEFAHRLHAGALPRHAAHRHGAVRGRPLRRGLHPRRRDGAADQRARDRRRAPCAARSTASRRRDGPTGRATRATASSTSSACTRTTCPVSPNWASSPRCSRSTRRPAAFSRRPHPTPSCAPTSCRSPMPGSASAKAARIWSSRPTGRSRRSRSAAPSRLQSPPSRRPAGPTSGRAGRHAGELHRRGRLRRVHRGPQGPARPGLSR